MTTSFIKHVFLTIAVLTLSATAAAAKPTSIKYIEDVVIDNDLIYSHYRVNCSDGRVTDISAWNNQKKWCVGKGRQDDCSKKQINTAKKVCR